MHIIWVLKLECILQLNATEFTDGADFIAGRYNATFTPGATTATTSIPITADSIYEPNAESFYLRLYIDGAGYQLGLYKEDISKATVFIVGNIVHSLMYLLDNELYIFLLTYSVTK